MTHPTRTHIPVMLPEVLHYLAPKEGGIYVDGTFGVGGYSRGILGAAKCRVYGIDRDPDAVSLGQALAQSEPRFTMIAGRFGAMRSLLQEQSVENVDGIALDLGVSSPQLDKGTRGFSFREDGPLDMRMEQAGRSAADIVNETAETELARIIYVYGEERCSRRVARAIVAARLQKPIHTTFELAEIIRSVVPKSKDGIDPATRTFQALRIEVNQELQELEDGLENACALLNDGGRLVVVSFHSLEDRIVKSCFQKLSGRGSNPSRHAALFERAPSPTLKLLTNKVVPVSEDEARANPRARSARLRAAEKIGRAA